MSQAERNFYLAWRMAPLPGAALREIRAECDSYIDLNKVANLVVYAIKRIAGDP